jgi:hypothetical protein
MLKVKNAPVRVQYNKIIELLAEDYRPAKKYFENVEFSIGPMILMRKADQAERAPHLKQTSRK